MTALIFVTTLIASSYMADVLPHKGATAMELTIVIVFAALFAWISIGFWESLAGLYTLLRRYDRFTITRTVADQEPEFAPDTRTAILVPVCNEDIARVCAGLKATYKSLEATGKLGHFDFFILSDTSNPDLWVAEEIAWYETCKELTAFDRIFYRHRRVNIKRKSGNIADFCRRWGRNYRYMIVFDADSVMAGQQPGAHGTDDGEEPPRGHPADLSPGCQQGEPYCPRAAVFQPRVRTDVCCRPAFYPARGFPFLGP